MADQKKPSPAAKTTVTVTTVSAPKPAPKQEKRLVFERENYMLFFTGIAFITIGYLVMAGGKSPDPNQFYPDQIFAWRRINLAPALVLLGFGIEILAIMYRKKKAE